jgi:hypothetical protein
MVYAFSTCCGGVAGETTLPFGVFEDAIEGSAESWIVMDLPPETENKR